MDRWMALARKAHDADLCPSGAGPQHYRDECDEDSPTFTDPEPEPVESTCAWLVAQDEYDAENSKEGHIAEKGLLVGWRDASVPRLDRPGDERDHGQAHAGNTDHGQ